MPKLVIAGVIAAAAAILPAQDGETRDRSIAVPATVAHDTPTTVGDKFRYHLRRSFDEIALIRTVGGAAFDEARDHPEGWGRGWDSYGARVASHFGQHLITEQILFGVQSLDRETPLHLRSTRTGFRNRAIDAIRYTFLATNHEGRIMPAYSRFAAAYGSAFISRTWYPSEYHTVAAGFSAGSTALAVDVGMSLLREFGPDIRKLFRRR